MITVHHQPTVVDALHDIARVDDSTLTSRSHAVSPSPKVHGTQRIPAQCQKVERVRNRAIRPRAPGLTENEQRIVRYIDEKLPNRGTALLQELVDINSGTFNVAGVKKVGERVEAELHELGFATTWHDASSVGRGAHLFAERRAEGAKCTILLIGHLDTVFEPTSGFDHFERVDASTARGPGVMDMKSGVVSILTILAALKSVGALDALNVRVALMADEEFVGRDPDGSTRTSRDPLRHFAEGVDFALGFEPGVGTKRGDYSSATIARRGSGQWRLDVEAPTGHSSHVFGRSAGPGAIYPAAMVVSRFYELLKGETYLTSNAATALGGAKVTVDTSGNRDTVESKPNIVPAHAVMAGDLRFIDDAQRDKARARMVKATAAVQKQMDEEYPRDDGSHTVELKIAFADQYPAMSPTQANSGLLALLSKTSEDLGLGTMTPVDPGLRGAADISFVANIAHASLSGLGSAGIGEHSDKETIYLDEWLRNTKRVAVMIGRLANYSGAGLGLDEAAQGVKRSR